MIAQLREDLSHYRLLIGSVEDAKRIFREQCGVPLHPPSSTVPFYGHPSPPARRGAYPSNRGGGSQRGRGANSGSSSPYRRRGKTDAKKAKDHTEEAAPKTKTAREHNEELTKTVAAQNEEILRLNSVLNADN